MSNVHNFAGSSELSLLLPPATQGSLNTSWVAPFADGGGAGRAVFMLQVGATTQNVTMKVTQAQDSSGTGAKDITGASITAITSSTDNVVVTIEVGEAALDDNNGFKYIRAEVTVASAGTTPYSVALIKHRLRRTINEGSQPASYPEQVVVLGR